jgi:hypothetical protein
VKGLGSISFRIAAWYAGAKETFSPHWAIQCGTLPAGWIVAIRLGERNKAVLDYLLLRVTGREKGLMRFSEKARVARGIDRFEDFDALVRSLIRRATASRIPATKVPTSKKRRSGRSNKNAGRALHRGSANR